MFFLLLFLAPQLLQEKEVTANPLRTQVVFASLPIVHRRRTSSQKNIFQKKKEKKKADKRKGQWRAKRKRNKSRRVKNKKEFDLEFLFYFSLCRKLLAGWCVGCPFQLSCLFILFYSRNLSFLIIPLMKIKVF